MSDVGSLRLAVLYRAARALWLNYFHESAYDPWNQKTRRVQDDSLLEVMGQENGSQGPVPLRHGSSGTALAFRLAN